MKDIFDSLILILLAVVVYFLKDLPNLYRELTLENKKKENQSVLQIESYFRQISGNEIQQVFNKWMSYVQSPDKLAKEMSSDKSKEKIIELQSKTLMYGSAKTVKILAKMMQHIYNSPSTNNAKIENASGDINSMLTLLYMANLAASLKEDFTGYVVNPVQLLETRITDINSNHIMDTIKTAQKIIDDVIKEDL